MCFIREILSGENSKCSEGIRMGKGKKQGCDLGLGLASTSRGWEEELIAILD